MSAWYLEQCLVHADGNVGEASSHAKYIYGMPFKLECHLSC